MLEQYFLRPTTVDRIPSNWLGPQIEQYVEWMHAQKYAQRNITRRAQHKSDFVPGNKTSEPLRGALTAGRRPRPP
jgi:integrase/recombinase XerD